MTVTRYRASRSIPTAIISQLAPPIPQSECGASRRENCWESSRNVTFPSTLLALVPTESTWRLPVSERSVNRGCVYSFVLSGDETKIRVFDLAAGQQLIDLKNHTASVKSLCWSSDSRKLMSGCSDGSFYIWNINNLGLKWVVCTIALDW